MRAANWRGVMNLGATVDAGGHHEQRNRYADDSSAPDPATGALIPTNLAKIYMWSSAVKATTKNSAELAEIEHLEQ